MNLGFACAENLAPLTGEHCLAYDIATAKDLAREALAAENGYQIPTLNARIAVFSGNYNYVRDGANQALNRLVAHLERRGAEVLVFSPVTDNPAFAHAGELSPTPSVPFPRRPEYRFPLGLPRKSREILRKFNPDLLHVSSPDLLCMAAIKFAHANGKPVVASVHTRFETYLDYYGIGFLEGLLKWHMRRFYAGCKQVYAPSPSMARELETTGLVSSPRIWSRGVNADMFSPVHRSEDWRARQGFAPNDVVIAFASRLVLEKGLAQFTRVLALLRVQALPFRVLILGEGPERARLETALPGAVFTGHISGPELGRAYASADLFLFPSLTETFGNVTLEAMAAGLVPVCANATGASSLIESGTTGFLCDPARDQDFVDQLAFLIRNPVRRAEMARAGRRASLEYSWDVVLDRLIWQYLELIPHTSLDA